MTEMLRQMSSEPSCALLMRRYTPCSSLIPSLRYATCCGHHTPLLSVACITSPNLQVKKELPPSLQLTSNFRLTDKLAYDVRHMHCINNMHSLQHSVAGHCTCQYSYKSHVHNMQTAARSHPLTTAASINRMPDSVA